MAISGSLQDIDLFSLIQMLCQDPREARITLSHNDDREAYVYLAGGNIVHAVLSDLEGEEVVFKVIAWQQANFSVERPVAISAQTIFTNWTGLLLEGMRRLDEAQLQLETADIFAEEPDRPANMTSSEEALWTKRATLVQIARDLVASEAGLESAFVVSSDGLTLVAEFPGDSHEPAKVGALAAGLLGMGQRSVHQLKHNHVHQIIVNAEGGHMVIVQVNTQLLLVGIVPAEGNVSSALSELSAARQRLSTLLEQAPEPSSS